MVSPTATVLHTPDRTAETPVSISTATPPSSSTTVQSPTPVLYGSNVDLINHDGLTGNWVKSVLNGDVDGQAVISWFESHGCLVNRKRTILSRILVRNELKTDVSKLIKAERFSSIAIAITDCFQCETTDTYYIPRRRNSLNKVCKAKGKLYTSWINMRKGFRKDNLIVGRRNLDPADDSSSESGKKQFTEPCFLVA